MNLDAIRNDPSFKAIFEDMYTFTLDGITVSVRCKIDSWGVHYYPDAISSIGEKAAARILPWRNPFEGLVFAHPPAWLIRAINPDYSMYTEAQKGNKRRGEEARPPELYIPLWELPEIQGPLKHWAREHPFIGRKREVLKAWKSRRGTIEVIKYDLQEHHHLEIRRYDTTTRTYSEAERLAGHAGDLLHIAGAMSAVAGMREQKVKVSKPKKEKKVIPFPG